MRLYVVRHPRPLVASGVCYGTTDVACDLPELHNAALVLRNALPKGLEIMSSPLQRCERLAQVLKGLEPDLAYKTDARLAEMDFGTWEMQRWDALQPDELTAWTNDFAGYRCGGMGESTGQFVQRVIQRLIESAQAGKDQIWITHAGVIRALLWLRAQPASRLAQYNAIGFWQHQLHARDWPQGEVAFGRMQTWDWPPDWRLDWFAERR